MPSVPHGTQEELQELRVTPLRLTAELPMEVVEVDKMSVLDGEPAMRVG